MASKQTVLKEDASIYQKREQKSEKQKWSEMDRKARIEYFNEYYRGKLIWLVIGVGAGIWLLYSILGPKVDQVLYVAVINDYWNDKAVDALQTDLKEYLGSDSKWEEVLVDDIFYFKDDSSSDAAQYLQKLAAYIFAGDVDLLISDEDQFGVYASQDYFHNLAEVLPADLYDEVKDYLVYYVTEEGGDSIPVGIRLGSSKVFRAMNGYEEDPVLGIMGNTHFTDNAIAAIRYFFEVTPQYDLEEDAETE